MKKELKEAYKIMKKELKEAYNDFNVPINNRGGYIEMGGFTICLLIVVFGIILFDKFDLLYRIINFIY